MYLFIGDTIYIYIYMSRDDGFEIIQIENKFEASYNSPGVPDVWLIIYK